MKNLTLEQKTTFFETLAISKTAYLASIPVYQIRQLFSQKLYISNLPGVIITKT